MCILWTGCTADFVTCQKRKPAGVLMMAALPLERILLLCVLIVTVSGTVN